MVSLAKGQKVSLAKVAKDSGVNQLKRLLVGLYWDSNEYAGGGQHDLDASAFILDENDKVTSDKDFIFYNNLTAPGVKHMGDERTGASEGDDEQILIEMDALPAYAKKVRFGITIFDQENKLNFGQVKNCGVHIADADSGVDLIRYDLGEDFSIETSVVVGEIYLSGGEWKFNPIGSGHSTGLQGLCAQVGIQAE